jgi:HAMP domain-containing protein
MSGSVRSKSWFSWLPTLRFRAKISLGFALVLLISAVSLGTAYFRFEGVSKAVASYRNSVAEADLARNIDRELISYRLLVKYYVVTAKEEDAKAAQAAEASLKDAIDKSLAGTKTPARREGLNKLATEFRNFAATFAEIVKVKGESALLVQNQLQSNANMLKYKLDDILSNASESEQQAIESGTRRVTTQFQAASAAANTFVLNADQMVATNALARLDFVAGAFDQVYSMDDKIVAELKEAKGFLVAYRQALQKLVENSGTVADLVTQMSGSAGAISQGAGAMKADLVSEQQRLEAQSDAMIGETEQLIIMLAVGGTILGAILALLLGRGISRPMIAMCKAMRELAGGNFDVVLPGLGQRDEVGEMAGAVEEFKLQAIARAERDTAAQDAQNREAGAARRAELIRFADDFETAVGSIVSNVSTSAVHPATSSRLPPRPKNCRHRSMQSVGRCGSPIGSRRPRSRRRSRPTPASANFRAQHRRSGTSSS